MKTNIPEYKILEQLSETDVTPIKILDGDYAGLVFKVVKLWFGDELTDGSIQMNFNCEVFDNDISEFIPITDIKIKEVISPIVVEVLSQKYGD